MRMRRAPVLEELVRQTALPLRDGRTVVADDDYLRESILHPGAKVVAGCEDIMPTFEGQVSEEEMIQLIAFIKSLQPGETPARVETYPAAGANESARDGNVPSEPSPTPAKREEHEHRSAESADCGFPRRDGRRTI